MKVYIFHDKKSQGSYLSTEQKACWNENGLSFPSKNFCTI